MERRHVVNAWEADADSWTRPVRAGYDIDRDALNSSAFLAMLPPIGGLDGSGGENACRRHRVDFRPARQGSRVVRTARDRLPHG